MQLAEANAEAAVLRAQNSALQKRNAQLEEEIALLRAGVAPASVPSAAPLATAAAPAAQHAAAAPMSEGPAAVTREERERLAQFIQAIADSNNAEVVAGFTTVLNQHRPAGATTEGNEVTIDVWAFDEATVRGLLAYCEPLFTTEETVRACTCLNLFGCDVSFIG